jgi:hypothetical protein
MIECLAMYKEEINAQGHSIMELKDRCQDGDD